MSVVSLDESAAAPLKLLIADDDVDALEEMREMIELEGWECVVATSIESALEMLDGDQAISVVVTDVHFDDPNGSSANGIQFLSRAKARFPGRAISYLVLSGDPASQRASDQVGAFAFLSKPLKVEEFIGKLNSAAESGGVEPDVVARAHELSNEIVQ